MEQKTIKLEMHAHCLGGSGCASVPAKQLVEEYKNKDYGAIVLTNHICESEYVKYPGKTHKEKIDYYLSLFDAVKSEGEKVRLKVFLGAEVRVKYDGFMEFMIYGFDKSFLYDNPPLYGFTQEELFELCDKNGIFLYQTHPFRSGVDNGNPEYMHGAECFNGHVNHVNNNNFAMEFCEKYDLIKTCGSDFHDCGQPITAYALIPETIDTDKKLSDYIKSGKLKIFGDEETYRNLCRKN